MALAPEAILKQYGDLLAQRRPYEADWRDCATYILPRKRTAIGQKPNPGEKQTQRLYDSTAIHANSLLGASLQGSLTSGAVRWFRFRMRNEDLNRDVEVQQWLEDCSSRVYSVLQQSNWNAEVFETYLDLGAFGTSALFMAEREDVPSVEFRGMLFKAIPIGTYVIQEDAEGRVDTLMAVYSQAAGAVVRKYGPEACGQRLTELALRKPTEDVDLLQAVIPRPGGLFGRRKQQKPWASYIIAERDKRILQEGGYDRFPFAVARWTKASGETYGRGPGHTALPDIRTLNKMTELELRQIAKAIDPPMLARDHGVVGTIRMTPGAVTTVRDDPRTALIPFESGARGLQVGQIKGSELKAAIRDMFFNSQLQLPTNQPMTATEIERRYELMNRVLGPTLGRLSYEQSDVVPMHTFVMMFRRGALPPPPPMVMDAAESGQDHIDLVSEGPLARAQKGSDVLAIERTFGMVLPLAQIDPTALDVYKWDEVARVIGEASGVPARCFAAVQDIAAKQVQRQQAEEEQKMMQMAETASGAAKNMAPFLTATSQMAATGANGTTPAMAPPAAA